MCKPEPETKTREELRELAGMLRAQMRLMGEQIKDVERRARLAPKAR